MPTTQAVLGQTSNVAFQPPVVNDRYCLRQDIGTRSRHLFPTTAAEEVQAARSARRHPWLAQGAELMLGVRDRSVKRQHYSLSARFPS